MIKAKAIPKAYEAKEIEAKIYRLWEESGYFNPDNLPGKRPEKFVIAMPPPNVTGILHLGHALENALMDAALRYHRMLGQKALLIPGTDHAAVATQARVEDELKKQGIKNPRQDLGRAELLKRTKEFAENHKAIILGQIRKMGTSCDWSRLAYTFDESRSAVINELFKRMHQDGLIYRGYRVVNWSVKGQSTCSDDELVYREEKTRVYTFKYSQDFPIPIATTRPETKLGDTAVAINSKDKRYQKYLGQKFIVDVGAAKPLTITIIADSAVDPDYGTGAVGVTPAHSAIDYEMYLKNKAIGLIPVIDTNGKMTTQAGLAYQGLTTLAAREKFVAWLKDKKLFIKEEVITHSVGTSDRFGDKVEALPLEQWFIDVNKIIPGRKKSLKDLMREAVTSGHNGDPNKKIIITPERFQKIYLGWIDNLRDWNISRQIWWGHRIPVWYKKSPPLPEGGTKGGWEKKQENKKIKNQENQEIKITEKEIYVGAKPPTQAGWTQDEDTLDTWFSSGAWTFSILGWPKKTKDLKNFHPTTWMQMGYEILFFWLARMILMTTYALDDIPFKQAYIHGMLRDKNGRKFSKSLGNGLDPLEIINKYGADALRLSLLKGVAPGNDSRFYEEKVEGARNFVNKLWNISRFILQDVKKVKLITREPSAKTLADQWILQRYRLTVALVNQALAQAEFSSAIEKLWDFTWSDLADWYVEVSKVESRKSKVDADSKNEILLYILQNLLKLWHPFIPFVTEQLWQNFNSGKLLMIENYPRSVLLLPDPLRRIEARGETPRLGGAEGVGASRQTEEDFELVKNIIIAIRNLKAEYKIEPKKKIKVVIYAGQRKKLLDEQSELIKGSRTGLAELEILKSGAKPKNSAGAVLGPVEIYLDLSGIIDIKAEQKRLNKKIKASESYLQAIEAKLANRAFVKNAPATVVKQEQEKLAAVKAKTAKLKNNLANLL